MLYLVSIGKWQTLWKVIEQAKKFNLMVLLPPLCQFPTGVTTAAKQPHRLAVVDTGAIPVPVIVIIDRTNFHTALDSSLGPDISSSVEAEAGLTEQGREGKTLLLLSYSSATCVFLYFLEHSTFNNFKGFIMCANIYKVQKNLLTFW